MNTSSTQPRPEGMPRGIALNLDICDRLDAMTDDELAARLRELRVNDSVAFHREHTRKVRARMAASLAALGMNPADAWTIAPSAIAAAERQAGMTTAEAFRRL